MTEKQVATLRGKFSTKVGGLLYGLFFKGRHFTPNVSDDNPSVLLSNDQIFEGLEIDLNGVNSLEYEGLLRLLGAALWRLRKDSKLRQQPWLDVTFEDANKKVAYHGFADDPNKAVSCIARFNRIADGARRNARLTQNNLRRAFPQIEQNDKTAA